MSGILLAEECFVKSIPVGLEQWSNAALRIDRKVGENVVVEDSDIRVSVESNLISASLHHSLVWDDF